MLPSSWLQNAQEQISNTIVHTPMSYDEGLDIYLKWENHQVTGSFKARGALNKVLGLQPWERKIGLVTASAGNHGQGLALAGKIAGASVTVFTYEHAVPAKIRAMQALGAQVYLIPGGYAKAEQTGLAYAQESQSTWVSPYNDGQVIAGQGTLALEILEDAPQLAQATWIVPAGGGGLVSGVGAALHIGPQTSGARLIAVQSESSSFLHGLFTTGSQAGLDDLPTLADGLSGEVEQNSITIPLARKYVDDFILVNETEIAAAIAYAWENYQERIEGSAAVTLAAILTGKIAARPAVLILTGGNIEPELHARIINNNFMTVDELLHIE